MDYPQMIYNGKLTEAGQEVVTYIEKTIQQATEGVDNRADALNRLPGHIRHYIVSVDGADRKGKREQRVMQFVADFERSSVKYAWQDMVFLQEQTQQTETVAETAGKTSQLEEALETLREELMNEINKQGKQISSLKGENTKLRKRLQEAEADTDDTDEAGTEAEPQDDDVADDADESGSDD